MAESREWLEPVLDGLPDAVVVTEAAPPQRIVYANQAFEAASGHDRTAAVGRTLEELRGSLRIVSGTAERGEAIVRHRDGSDYVVEVRRRAIPADGAAPADGEPRWLLEVQRAVRGAEAEALREAEAALRRVEEAFVSFVHLIPDPIVLHREGRFVLVNPSFRALTGYERPEDLLGRRLLELVDPEDQAYVRGRLAMPHHERSGNFTAEHHIQRSDGTRVPVEVATVPVIYEGQLASLALVRDLRERKSLEAQLIAADRLASLGRLSAAIGHEINNPLAYIGASLDLLNRELEGHASSESYDRLFSLAKIARDGTDRIRTIIGDMKALSRGDAGDRGSVDILGVLDRCAAFANHEIRHRASLVKDYAPVPHVRGSEPRLGQVFLNLLLNAAQAIPDGNVERNAVTISTAVEDEHVVVRIRDTGSGVDPAARELIFEPFFTTNGSHAGTGLGLSISHHIVTALGGHLSLESTSPEGSCFRVVLPVSAD